MRTSRRLLAAAAAAALAVIVGVALPAGSEAPHDLSVYAGQGIATPIGLISRVPAESAGGVIYSETDLDIGKARSQAAGATPGNLAEAFLATTLQGYSNPSLVAAQYPPSQVFPSEATAPNSVSGGGASAGRFHAVADGIPSATADATGGAGGVPNVFRAGGATSRSHSEVLADGTVVTTAMSSLQDVRIGPDATPMATISHLTSTAEVRVPFGGAPVGTLTVDMAGLLVGGVPVTISQDGITVAGSVPVPATALTTVNQALAQLDAHGIRLQAVPVTKTSTATNGTVTGAAMEIAYKVPPQAQLPTDIGKDETFLLGEVSAQAAGRRRTPLSLALPAPVPTPSPELASGVEGTAAPSIDLAPPPAATAAPATPYPAAPVAAPFRIQRHVRNAAAAKVLSGYGMVLLAALLAAAVYLIFSRARLTE
jgi:hypothetical protein